MYIYIYITCVFLTVWICIDLYVHKSRKVTSARDNIYLALKS